MRKIANQLKCVSRLSAWGKLEGVACPVSLELLLDRGQNQSLRSLDHILTLLISCALLNKSN